MDVTKILMDLAFQNPQALFKLNIKLIQGGLPFYYNGGASFNTLYRLAPTPRYIITWRPPFVKLNQIYLSYKPGSAEQIDIVYYVDEDRIELTPIK